jgi:hypothetical protein
MISHDGTLLVDCEHPDPDRVAFFLDFGGSVMTSWVRASVVCNDGFEFFFWPHQLDQVYFTLSGAIDLDGETIVKGWLRSARMHTARAMEIQAKIKERWLELGRLRDHALNGWDRATDVLSDNDGIFFVRTREHDA